MKQYSERWDAYYDSNANEWLESKCDDPTCEYCVNRPEKPMNENIKAGADLHAGDGGYSIGTQEKYEEFARRRMNQYSYFVICSECSEEHLTTEVEALNVEEDSSGRDVFYFLCPVTQTETKSLVYRK